jgi:KUP system potassium uptake protein
MGGSPDRGRFLRLLDSEGPAPMVRWRKRLFAFMSWNASSATDFFGIPAERVLKLGARIDF